MQKNEDEDEDNEIDDKDALGSSRSLYKVPYF